MFFWKYCINYLNNQVVRGWEGDRTLPLGAMEIVRSTFFLKTIIDKMKKSISVEQKNAFL